MKRIAAFDFDGTLTRRDTLIEFIRSAKGSVALCLGLLRYSPWIVAARWGLYHNGRAKERLFAHFFKGMTLGEFNRLCATFFEQQSATLLYREAMAEVERHLAAGDEVVVISASIENWVRPFTESLRIPHLLCTQIEVSADGRLTGRFLSANCYGEEKVSRLLSQFPDRASYHLTAYGDSGGDERLMAFADKCYYRKFKN